MGLLERSNKYQYPVRIAYEYTSSVTYITLFYAHMGCVYHRGALPHSFAYVSLSIHSGTVWLSPPPLPMLA